MCIGYFAVQNHHLQPGQQSAQLDALREALTGAEETLLVLDKDGTVLQRIWCLYEAWQACRAGPGKLRLLASDIELTNLREVRKLCV